ncbi:MAG TPA: hypothetical protein VFV38_44250 [Ktedonobacteraceae bacterium]|nr:hypothetical protein [Ktedonobacteraceae bacterium]
MPRGWPDRFSSIAEPTEEKEKDKPLQKSRKRLLRLDRQTRYREEQEYFEDEQQSRKEARRSPRYTQFSEEVFKCRHCHRFVCPLHYGDHHRNRCPFWIQRTGTLYTSCGGYR